MDSLIAKSIDLLLHLYGQGAAEIAYSRMYEYLDIEDVKNSALWLGIGYEIENRILSISATHH